MLFATFVRGQRLSVFYDGRGRTTSDTRATGARDARAVQAA